MIANADEILQPGQGRQTGAAAMFVDLRDFTRVSAALAPAQLIGLLAEYQRIVVPVVQRNGGSIITPLGDGVMIAFGAMRLSATCASDACCVTAPPLPTLSLSVSCPESSRVV